MADPSLEETNLIRDRLLKVVATLESVQSSGAISPDTSAAVEKLLNKSHSPSTDIEILEVAASPLQKSHDRKIGAPRAR